MRKAIDAALLFLARPFGGLELETFLAVFCELSWACALIFFTKATWYSPSLRFLYGVVPGYLLAAPWLLASCMSIFGIILYFLNNPRCALFRWWGAFISMWLWFWVFTTSAFTTQAETPHLGFYLGASIASFRIMLGAWRRGAWRRPS
jgi:hypothetical protein